MATVNTETIQAVTLGDYFLVPSHATQLEMGFCQVCGKAFQGIDVVLLYRTQSVDSAPSTSIKKHALRCTTLAERVALVHEPHMFSVWHHFNREIHPGTGQYLWPRNADELPSEQSLRALTAFLKGLREFAATAKIQGTSTPVQVGGAPTVSAQASAQPSANRTVSSPDGELFRAMLTGRLPCGPLAVTQVESAKIVTAQASTSTLQASPQHQRTSENTAETHAAITTETEERIQTDHGKSRNHFLAALRGHLPSSPPEALGQTLAAGATSSTAPRVPGMPPLVPLPQATLALDSMPNRFTMISSPPASPHSPPPAEGQKHAWQHRAQTTLRAAWRDAGGRSDAPIDMTSSRPTSRHSTGSAAVFATLGAGKAVVDAVEIISSDEEDAPIVMDMANGGDGGLENRQRAAWVKAAQAAKERRATMPGRTRETQTGSPAAGSRTGTTAVAGAPSVQPPVQPAGQTAATSSTTAAVAEVAVAGASTAATAPRQVDTQPKPPASISKPAAPVVPTVAATPEQAVAQWTVPAQPAATTPLAAQASSKAPVSQVSAVQAPIKLQTPIQSQRPVPPQAVAAQSVPVASAASPAAPAQPSAAVQSKAAPSAKTTQPVATSNATPAVVAPAKTPTITAGSRTASETGQSKIPTPRQVAKTSAPAPAKPTLGTSQQARPTTQGSLVAGSKERPVSVQSSDGLASSQTAMGNTLSTLIDRLDAPVANKASPAASKPRAELQTLQRPAPKSPAGNRPAAMLTQVQTQAQASKFTTPVPSRLPSSQQSVGSQGRKPRASCSGVKVVIHSKKSLEAAAALRTQAEATTASASKPRVLSHNGPGDGPPGERVSKQGSATAAKQAQATQATPVQNGNRSPLFLPDELDAPARTQQRPVHSNPAAMSAAASAPSKQRSNAPAKSQTNGAPRMAWPAQPAPKPAPSQSAPLQRPPPASQTQVQSKSATPQQPLGALVATAAPRSFPSSVKSGNQAAAARSAAIASLSQLGSGSRPPTLDDVQRKTPSTTRALQRPGSVVSSGSSSQQPLRPKFNAQLLAQSGMATRGDSSGSSGSEGGNDAATIEANYRASLVAALQETTGQVQPAVATSKKRSATEAALQQGETAIKAAKHVVSSSVHGKLNTSSPIDTRTNGRIGHSGLLAGKTNGIATTVTSPVQTAVLSQPGPKEPSVARVLSATKVPAGTASLLRKRAMESLQKLKSAMTPAPTPAADRPVVKGESSVKVRVPDRGQECSLAQFASLSVKGQRTFLASIGIQPVANRSEWFLDDFCQLVRHVQKTEHRLDQLSQMIYACATVEEARRMLQARTFAQQLSRFAKGVQKNRDEHAVAALLKPAREIPEAMLDLLATLLPAELVKALQLRGLGKKEAEADDPSAWLTRLQKTINLPQLSHEPRNGATKGKTLKRAKQQGWIPGTDEVGSQADVPKRRRIAGPRRIADDSDSISSVDVESEPVDDADWTGHSQSQS